MQVVVRLVDREEAENAAAVHKSKDRHETVDDTEDDEVQAGRRFTGGGSSERDDAAQEVNDVMNGVDLKDKNRIHKEARDADEQQNDPKDPCKRFNHKKGREKE